MDLPGLVDIIDFKIPYSSIQDNVRRDVSYFPPFPDFIIACTQNRMPAKVASNAGPPLTTSQRHDTGLSPWFPGSEYPPL